MKKIVLLSGGLDSSALLFHVKDENTIAVFYDYGQRAVDRERKAARYIASAANTELIELSLSDVFRNSHSTLITPNGTTTEVENRNAVLVMATISYAIQVFEKEPCNIYIAVAQMREPFSDCSSAFIDAVDHVAKIVSDNRVRVYAPFCDKGKDEIFEIAKKLGAPTEQTWSCYEGGEEPCGRCPACVDRNILGG